MTPRAAAGAAQGPWAVGGQLCTAQPELLPGLRHCPLPPPAAMLQQLLTAAQPTNIPEFKLLWQCWGGKTALLRARGGGEGAVPVAQGGHRTGQKMRLCHSQSRLRPAPAGDRKTSLRQVQ